MPICNATKANGTACTHEARYGDKCHYHRVREPRVVVLNRAAAPAPLEPQPAAPVPAPVRPRRRAAPRPRPRPRRLAGPPPRLQQLGADQQNVHTPEVNDQSAQGERVLLGIKLKPGVHYLAGIGMAFYEHAMGISPEAVRRVPEVMSDVQKWYDTESCRWDKDNLYLKLLRGAWTLIDSSPHRKDLVGRLWEECCSGVGMCCQGHISRVVNVFVGFDDRFAPPVALGEQIQNKMSAIVNQGFEPDVARRMAAQALKDLGVPEDQQVAWLEAF